jgi:hypothetical protein
MDALDGDGDDDDEESMPLSNIISNQPCIRSIPSASMVPGMGPAPIRRDSVIVMIRHGKTEHNKLGLFTGWEVSRQSLLLPTFFLFQTKDF